MTTLISVFSIGSILISALLIIRILMNIRSIRTTSWGIILSYRSFVQEGVIVQTWVMSGVVIYTILVYLGQIPFWSWIWFGTGISLFIYSLMREYLVGIITGIGFIMTSVFMEVYRLSYLEEMIKYNTVSIILLLTIISISGVGILVGQTRPRASSLLRTLSLLLFTGLMYGLAIDSDLLWSFDQAKLLSFWLSPYTLSVMIVLYVLSVVIYAIIWQIQQIQSSDKTLFGLMVVTGISVIGVMIASSYVLPETSVSITEGISVAKPIINLITEAWFALLYFLLMTWYQWSAITEKMIWKVNGGMVLLFIFTFSRYFELFGQQGRGIAFLSLGVFAMFLAWGLEKIRTKLLQTIQSI